LFIGLELMSIPIYALAGFDRRRLSSNESALKYFLIGSFASAILLYGVALLYGATGSTSFAALRAGFDPHSPLALTGLGLVVVGFAFKVAAVPFHQWAPDVYEGAPSSVTAFMSVAVKATGVFALLRMLALGVAPIEGSAAVPLDQVFAGLAVLSMVVGNLMMLIQDNVKRMLAYSGVAHAGYLLVGVAAGTAESWAAVVFYLIAYTFMNLGAFAIVVALAQGGRDCERVASFAGLARARPGLAMLMTLFLLALAGIPATAGFFAKFGIFSAAVSAGFVPLAIVGVLMSIVSVYAYLRIPVLMYMREPGEFAGPPAEAQSGERFVLVVCAAVVLALGILPNGGTLIDFSLGEQEFMLRLPPVLDWARAAVAALVS
jgi:NADH-quinone oxidoreductase subunit N